MTILIAFGIIALVAVIAAIRTAAVDGYHREPARTQSQ
jgi:hypothetical protein